MVSFLFQPKAATEHAAARSPTPAANTEEEEPGTSSSYSAGHDNERSGTIMMEMGPDTDQEVIIYVDAR